MVSNTSYNILLYWGSSYQNLFSDLVTKNHTPLACRVPGPFHVSSSACIVGVARATSVTPRLNQRASGWQLFGPSGGSRNRETPYSEVQMIKCEKSLPTTFFFGDPGNPGGRRSGRQRHCRVLRRVVFRLTMTFTVKNDQINDSILITNKSKFL